VWPFRRAERLGDRGERLAARLLRRRGMKVLATNYRCGAGEADLIVLDPTTRKDLGAETIAIVEVKTRTSDSHTAPEAAVDAHKRRRMKRIARHYLTAHPAADFAVRFDVVAVLAPPGGRPEVRHIPNAF
jgi:putative endonuclease